MMDKNQAQLHDDYGVFVGQIAVIDVVAPTGVLQNGQAYNLVYSSADKKRTLTAVAAG